MNLDESRSCEFVISKLDGTNYAAWNFKSTMLFTQKGLWVALTGNDMDLSNGKNSLGTIGLSVYDSQIVYIHNCSSGK